MVVAPSQLRGSSPCLGSKPGLGVQDDPLALPAAVTMMTPFW